MIYIDTRDQLSLKHGVMEFLNVTEEELELVFETIDSVDENPYDWVKKYLEDYGIDSPLEYIQMFHLTRRLNGTDLRTNNNLERLLLCKTPLSDLLRLILIWLSRRIIKTMMTMKLQKCRMDGKDIYFHSNLFRK